MRPVNLIPPDERRGEQRAAAQPARSPTSWSAPSSPCSLGVTALVLTGNQISDSKAEVVELEARRRGRRSAGRQRLAAYTQFREPQRPAGGDGHQPRRQPLRLGTGDAGTGAGPAQRRLADRPDRRPRRPSVGERRRRRRRAARRRPRPGARTVGCASGQDARRRLRHRAEGHRRRHPGRGRVLGTRADSKPERGGRRRRPASGAGLPAPATSSPSSRSSSPSTRRRSRSAEAAPKSPRPDAGRSRRNDAPEATGSRKADEMKVEINRRTRTDRRDPGRRRARGRLLDAPAQPEARGSGRTRTPGRKAAGLARPAPQAKRRRRRSRAQDFPDDYQQLVVLGKAVPADDETASLLVQVNRIADDAKVKFQSITLGRRRLGKRRTEASAAAPTGSHRRRLRRPRRPPRCCRSGPRSAPPGSA